MNLPYTPDIENIVLDGCNELIDQYHFFIQRKLRNEVFLVSEKCGIKILAGVSPIGEQQIEIDLFDCRLSIDQRKYYSHTFLLYLNTRSEPRDVLEKCSTDQERFDETIRESLKCFTAHTLKYRQDILSGDFTSWLPKKLLES